MITRKQYPNHHVFEMEIGGRAFTVETGKVAELANAECICRYGDTVVLVTCTCNPIPKAGNFHLINMMVGILLTLDHSCNLLKR